jgi:putative endonuclease
MSDAHALGKSGEEAAVAYLKKNKFKIIKQGFRFHRGEIDIIAFEKDTLVFIEVKTRKSLNFGLPEESVTPLKQQQIRKLAEAYLAMERLQDIPCRFDILSLFYSPKDGYQVNHLRGAF